VEGQSFHRVNHQRVLVILCGRGWQTVAGRQLCPCERHHRYVLWTRNDTGKATLWKINPSGATNGIIPIINSAWLYSSKGVGQTWQATSYTHVNDTTGYVLWARDNNGQAALWKVNPGNVSSSTVPIITSKYLASPGKPWLASSYKHISDTAGYVMWTRKDTGAASLAEIDPGTLAEGAIPAISTLQLTSPAGVGAQWQATSFVPGGIASQTGR